MYNRSTSFAGDARRPLFGAAANNAYNEEYAEEYSHHVMQTNRDDEEYDDDEYEQGESDGEDVEMNESHAGLVNYASDNDDTYDDEADNHLDERVASVDDLFAPGELEQRLAEEAAGIDPYGTDVGEDATDVDADDLEHHAADFDDDVADVNDEDRAAIDAVFDEIRRKAALDRAAVAAAYDSLRPEFASDASSSVGTITTCTGSDYGASRVGSPARGNARESRTPPPEDLAERKTPELYSVPATKAEYIDLTPSLFQSLVGAPRLLILRTLLGRDHGTKCAVSDHGPHTPFTSPRPSPAGSDIEDEPEGRQYSPSLRKRVAHIDSSDAPAELSAEVSAALAEASIPANRLRRTFDGDYFLRDGNGGYISVRTQRHVDHVWQPTFETNHMRLNARYHEAHRLAQASSAQASVAPALAQPTRPMRSPSVESEDVEMAGYSSSDGESGDSSPSPDERMSSQTPQQNVLPVRVLTPSPSPSHRPKHARSEDDSADDDAHTEKRRRVQTEAQPESPPAARARAGRRTRKAGSPTAATRKNVPIDTAVATAPALQSAGMTIVENNGHATNGFDEMPVDPLPVEAVAGPSRLPAEAPAAASPRRQPRRRGRAALQTPTEPPRRSSRIRQNELARAKAAAVAPAEKKKAKTRRAKRDGNSRA